MSAISSSGKAFEQAEAQRNVAEFLANLDSGNYEANDALIWRLDPDRNHTGPRQGNPARSGK